MKVRMRINVEGGFHNIHDGVKRGDVVSNRNCPKTHTLIHSTLGARRGGGRAVRLRKLEPAAWPLRLVPLKDCLDSS
jgi:hypothetical protein